MALPRNVEALIEYDGTYRQVVTETITTTIEESDDNGTYTAESGDTLWGIASDFLGAGIRYTEIYDANVDTIEATAQDHGFDSSDSGHWIWPGEELIIPGLGVEQQKLSQLQRAQELKYLVNLTQNLEV